MKPYYYVFRVNYAAPSKRHETIETAIAEAERLAAKHPEQSFEILKCVAVTSAPPPKPSTFWMDGEAPPSSKKTTSKKK